MEMLQLFLDDDVTIARDSRNVHWCGVFFNTSRFKHIIETAIVHFRIFLYWIKLRFDSISLFAPKRPAEIKSALIQV